MTPLKSVLLAVLLMSTSAPVAAAEKPMDHSMMPASAEHGFMAAMEKMMADMPKDYTGNPDVDFARMMVPHHQSAIAMPEVELMFGKDEKMRELAQKMIDMQKMEIDQLNAFIEANK